jgi:hypothetical protein
MTLSKKSLDALYQISDVGTVTALGRLSPSGTRASGGSGRHGQIVHCDFRITCKIVQTLVPTQWLRREGGKTERWYQSGDQAGGGGR